MREEKHQGAPGGADHLPTDQGRAGNVLKKGYYLTKGGYHARLDADIVIRGLGIVREIGFVAYAGNGEFLYKNEPYPDHPGESFDLLVETWQLQPFEEQGEPDNEREGQV